MGKVVVRAELDALGIDEDEPHLVGRVAHQQRCDDRVDAARLPRAGRAGDQHVREHGEVEHHRLAGDVAPEADVQPGGAARRLGRGEHVAERDDHPLLVRDLDADRAAPRDRREDAHVERRQRVLDVVAEPGDAVHLHARPELELVSRDGRPDGRADEPGFHAVVRERGLEDAAGLVDEPVVGLLVAATLQEVRGRELPVTRTGGRVVTELDDELTTGLLGGGHGELGVVDHRDRRRLRRRCDVGRRGGRGSPTAGGLTPGRQAGGLRGVRSASWARGVGAKAERAHAVASRAPLAHAPATASSERPSASNAPSTATPTRMITAPATPVPAASGAANSPPAYPPASRSSSSGPPTLGLPYARWRMPTSAISSRPAPIAIRSVARSSGPSGSPASPASVGRTTDFGQSSSTANAMHPTGIATRGAAQDRAAAVGEQVAHRPGETGPQPEREDQAEHHERDGDGVVAVTRELAARRVAGAGQRARLGPWPAGAGARRPGRRGASPSRLPASPGPGESRAPAPRLRRWHPPKLTLPTPATAAIGSNAPNP